MGFILLDLPFPSLGSLAFCFQSKVLKLATNVGRTGLWSRWGRVVHPRSLAVPEIPKKKTLQSTPENGGGLVALFPFPCFWGVEILSSSGYSQTEPTSFGQKNWSMRVILGGCRFFAEICQALFFCLSDMLSYGPAKKHKKNLARQ